MRILGMNIGKKPITQPIQQASDEKTMKYSEVESLLHSVVREVQANNSGGITDGIRSRLASAISGGYDMADTLHNVYLDFGYPQVLQFINFWNMYRRFGIASNIVEIPPDVCWSTNPHIESTDKTFKNELDEIIERLNMWHRMKGLDTRQRVGRYAGMFMRVADGKQPHEPLKGTLSGPASLVAMTPLYESQLTVQDTVDDTSSPDFGKPITYLYSTGNEGNRNEKARSSFAIHASRVIIAAEGADDGWIYGIPALEAVYNSLMDLRKIIGAGGEGFYRNASHKTVFSVKDIAAASQNPELIKEFGNEVDDSIRNAFRRSIMAPNMDVKTLQSTLISNEPHFNAALSDVAAGAKIPASIIIGRQTGRLAATEDGKHFLGGMNSRRENFLTEMIRNVLDWLIKYGVLTSAEYEIEWDDLLARSDDEKMETADKMSSINEKQFRAGQAAVFEENEIREMAGFDPEDELDEGNESDDLPDEDLFPEEPEMEGDE